MNALSKLTGAIAACLDSARALEAADVGLIAVCTIGSAFALRTICVLAGRTLGTYGPEQFRCFPRVPWRAPYRAWSALKRLHERTRLFGRRGGTGGFAGALGTMSLLFKPGKVLLGRAYAFGLPGLQPIGISPKRHLFALAQTGSGKTVLAITIVATWRGSVLIIDPKAQIVYALAGRDGRLWYIIDVDGLSGFPSACFNPFDWIKECQKRCGEGAAVLAAMRIAEALITTPPGNKSPFFYDLPRQFLAGVILHVLTVHPAKNHNLPYVRDLLIHGYRITAEDGTEVTTDGEPHELLLRIMLKNTAFDGVVAGAATAMANAAGETLGSLRSTLLEQTKWLDLPNVRRVLMRSDFSLADLKRRNDVVVAFTPSIYSVREELSRFARLLTNLTAYTFEQETTRKGSCLMVVDELAAQGYNPVFEVLLAVARSHGLLFFGIAQSVELMRRNYPDMYRSFIGEADATWWMGATHPDNQKLLCELLGKRTLVETDRHTGRKNYREVSVMEPEQIARFLDPNSQHLIVTRAGARPLKLVNEPYFKALPVWRYSPDPDHREALLRRLVRGLFDKGRKPFTHTEKKDIANDTSHEQ